jgi:hypothetical protein
LEFIVAQKRERKTTKKRTARANASKGWSIETMIVGGSVLAVIAAVAFIALSKGADTPQLDANYPDNSAAVPLMETYHLNPGEPAPIYNSNPPTSGPHDPRWEDIGVHLEALDDVNLVHNLEHGHIWISYRDADDTEAIDLLKKLAGQFPRYVIVTHRPEDETRIAAAAWGRLLTLDELDQEALEQFAVRYLDHAPESIPG